MTRERPRASTPLEEIPTGFRGRTLVTAKLAGRLGLAAAKKMLDMKGPAAADAADGRDAAEALASTLGRMKGLVMKVGQMASYLDGVLPPGTQQLLARLQAESEPVAFEQIARLIEAELGAKPSACFDSFEEKPIAAASIGQVHRAVLGGTPLAVKVQYPDIEKVLGSDADTIGTLLRVSTLGTAMNGKALAAELRERMLDECDFAAEADNQELFRKLLAGIAHASVPEVVRARSSRRVLTSVFADGKKFQSFVEDAGQEARNRAGGVMFEACFASIFRHGVFNADPHPGNYLFQADGSVTFLDFGCVKKLAPEHIRNWKRLASTVLRRDRRGFPEALAATGMAPAKEGKFDFDYQWGVFEYLYEPYFSTRPFTYTAEYNRRSYDLLLWGNPNKRDATLPPDWLLVNRLQWGLNSVLAQLGASVVWGDLFRSALEEPPAVNATPAVRSQALAPAGAGASREPGVLAE